MQRTINVHEVAIKTATVEIKSLRIGAKQMTLGVFRQLVNEPILDEETGELLGQQIQCYACECFGQKDV